MLRRRQLLVGLCSPVLASATPVETLAFSVRGVSDDPVLIQRHRNVHSVEGAAFLAKDRYGQEWLAFEPVYLNPPHIAAASVVPAQADQPAGSVALRVSLTIDGQAQLAAASREWLGRSLGVFLNSQLVQVATVQREVSSHSLELSLPQFSKEQLQELARVIKAET